MNMCLTIPLECNDKRNAVTRFVTFGLLCSIKHVPTCQYLGGILIEFRRIIHLRQSCSTTLLYTVHDNALEDSLWGLDSGP